MKKLYLLFFAMLSLICSTTIQAQDWKLVWSEEFDGPALDETVWNYEISGSGFGNQEKQYCTNRPENIKIEDGKLIITAIKEDFKVGNTTWKYTSARINTKNKKDFTYGKMVARVKFPKGGGVWPAFWMMGYGTWPTCGEIDIMEYVGNTPGEFQCNLHTKDYNGMSYSTGPKGQKFKLDGIEDDFHEYAIEWTDSKIKFFIDDQHFYSYGKVVGNEVNYPFTKPFYFILNMAIGGTMGGAINDNIFPQQYIVDYVRVYQDNPTGIENIFTGDYHINSVLQDNQEIKFPQDITGSKIISLHDVAGKTIFQITSRENTINLPAYNLEKGMYILNITTEKGNFAQKVLKK